MESSQSLPNTLFKNKILVAEDNMANQKIITAFLKSKGETEIASDGIKALKAIIPDIDLDDEMLQKIIDDLKKKLDDEKSDYKYWPIDQILADINTNYPAFKTKATQYYQFAAVVMDDQMPEMRGAVATILVRLFEQQMHVPSSNKNFIITCSDTFKKDNTILPFPGANTVTDKQPIKKVSLIKSIDLALEQLSKNTQNVKPSSSDEGEKQLQTKNKHLLFATSDSDTEEKQRTKIQKVDSAEEKKPEVQNKLEH